MSLRKQESFNKKIIVRKFLNKYSRIFFFIDFLHLPEISNDIKKEGRINLR